MCRQVPSFCLITCGDYCAVLTCDRPRVVAQDPLCCAKECVCGASQQVHSQEVSKKMTKLLRDDRSVLREDGAVEFKILAPVDSSQFESSPHWSNPTWLTHLQRGGGPKKRSPSVVPGFLFSRDYSKPSSNSRPSWRISN